MREANWDEIFQRHSDDGTAPAREGRLSSFVPWEDWLTFAITAVVFMSVVASIDGANWVRDMPSLYPVGFSALIVGYGLARVRRHEVLLHPIAALAGAAIVLAQLVAIVPGGSPALRIDHIVDRMHLWWGAATQNGLSADTLPFIVLVLVLTWIGTYFSSWAIFRWRNPWLGLVPGGTALMWNISFIPGQFSPAFLVFVFGAVLLVMRLNVARKESEWETAGVAYPKFISLSVLNWTFWVTVAILVMAYRMPLAARSDTANQRWNDFTAPIVRRIEPLARVFISVDAKKPIAIHNLQDALAFQGKITLTGKQAVQLNVALTPDMAAFLRAQSFDQYSAAGWTVNVNSNVPLAPRENSGVEAPQVADARKDVTINVKIEGGNNGVLFSLGQPVTADRPSDARLGAAPADVTSLKPADHLSNGDTYKATGSVAVASIDELRAAGTDYPSWVTDSYLQLPSTLPRRVRGKAREVVGGAGDTPYDKAVAIETYLRSFPVDYNVPGAPPGQDAVDYFLFDAQRGYFDYHASAMAVMLRTLGIPARVATGYAIDQKSSAGGNTYNLTEQNAFAWPEVYFPGIGWVEFSPTPSEPVVYRPGSEQPATPTASQPGPGARNQDQADLGLVPGGAAPTPAAAASKAGGGSSLWPLWIALIAAAGVVAVAGAAGKLAWEFGLGGLARPARLWEKTLRLAALAKARPRPHETPREFAARLDATVPGTGGVRDIAAAYERSRYGRTTAASAEEARCLDAAWASVRGGLLRRLLRLPPPASRQ
jgi:transglutaminase-like putative cysteine protease